MSLRDRLQVNAIGANGVVLLRPDAALSQANYQSLKLRIHQKLLDSVDLSIMESLPAERLREEIATLVERLLADDGAVINEVLR